VQVRHNIAKAGEIDLVRIHHPAHHQLDGIDHITQMRTLSRCKVGHFTDMGLPDHPTETGKRLALRTADTHDATTITLPKQFTPRRST